MTAKYGYARKSDCIITVDLTNETIDIEVDSKVQKLFGLHIEEAIRGVLTEMKIVGAKVHVEDYGALDFVIKARTKTAINQALNRGGNNDE